MSTPNIFAINHRLPDTRDQYFMSSLCAPCTLSTTSSVLASIRWIISLCTDQYRFITNLERSSTSALRPCLRADRICCPAHLLSAQWPRWLPLVRECSCSLAVLLPSLVIADRTVGHPAPALRNKPGLGKGDLDSGCSDGLVVVCGS